MAIAALLLGHRLLEPPLLCIRRMWRQCVWTMYVVEMIAALLVARGWALLGWPIVSVVTLMWALPFGVASPLHATLQQRRRPDELARLGGRR
ncbi:MAG: hypothetical protein IVW36_01515 [Dehalococcoidia bacterium]|nr:hypothetical protein [Dehalococcoidia bacterium]